jgi:membrane protein YqaA with SNARE-associated domain
MKLFTNLYDYTLRCSRHKNAPYYLGGVSFIEASFFPIPPDVMLAPMALASPERAWRFAAITTLTSALGALFGYVLGMFFMQWIHPLIIQFGYEATYAQVQTWFLDWGIWIIFLAGFSPIPFKLFTIAAGAVSMALLPFTITVLIGRGARFYLVSGLMRWGGAPMEKFLRRTVEWIGWAVVSLAIVGYVVYRLLKV